MLPGDLNFDPQKFPSFRDGQLETAQQVATSKSPLFLVEAPTGSGKSLLGLTTHKLMGEPRSAYIVSTKQLQDQIENDFNIPVLKGRNNYPCLHFPQLFDGGRGVTSEVCQEYLQGDECSFALDCPYLQQKRRALSASICVLNYPLFLTEANFVGGFSNLKFLILDEIDKAEDHLMSFIEVPITQHLMKRLNIGFPKFKTKLEAWVDWVNEVKVKVKVEINRLGPVEDLSPPQIRDIIRLKRTHKRLSFLSENLDDGWVLEQGDEKSPRPVVFKPVKVTGFAPSNLWKHTERALGMSATIMGAQSMALDLGLHTWDVDSISLPSPFPIESRRVNYLPVANVTHKTKDQAYPKLVRAIEEILRKHPKEKVLIHAVSYDLRNYLMRHISPMYHRLMTHDKDDRAIALERFKSINQPAVFISPSMERGIDLPGELCRVIIVAKVPWLDLSSPQVNKRLYGYSDGNLWYARKTARSLVQMTGRATRSMDDWSVSYILDEQFVKLVSRNKSIFPRWWVDSVQEGSL